MQNYFLPLILTLCAGMSTLLGGFITFFVKRDNLKALSVGLGFSAGVMIYISLNELMAESPQMLSAIYNPTIGKALAFAGFFLGIIIAVLIDYFIPDHIESDFLTGSKKCRQRKQIRRAGLITALAVTLHNFPEGMATFLVSSQDLRLGIPVALAIAIHNIPEGIAIALPIFHATGKKRLAILYSFLSGISEPVGGLIGVLLLKTIMPPQAVGIMTAAVAGIMVYLSFDTLLPLAREYGENHHVIIGIVSGMLIMGFGLIFL
ncbi:MAG: zinc transporter ZupT [Candidatus Gastranaerophilales bacterium]|nr:zinc transporter ZupT [Candidatus Gastranaerophilales bacterium]